MTTVRFSVGVAFLFSAAGGSTLAPIRPITQWMQRTISSGDEDGVWRWRLSFTYYPGEEYLEFYLQFPYISMA
jgi:hypothetical protein